jgi:single-strand DNA-binding protein
MAANINRIFLAGNLTRDPETKMVGGQQTVCNFGLAINRRWKGAGGEIKEEVTFVDVQAWDRVGELVGQYLTKGAPALVEGRLKLDTWEKDGQKQSKLRVVAEHVYFLGAKSDGDGGGETAAPAPAKATPRPAPARPVATDAAFDEPPF